MSIPRNLAIVLVSLVAAIAGTSVSGEEDLPRPLDWVRPSNDGTHFILAGSGERIVMWGVNYDHDGAGRLLEDYWEEQWDTVVEDFREIKALQANVVRIHLQVGHFLNGPEATNETSLARLARLVKLAEETGLYLDVTGLACYHKQDVPKWYDELNEQDRWNAQACFWRAVAEVCKDSPAVFCYDLMNEPIVPGKKLETDWLAGELGGKFFVQRLSLDRAGRTSKQIAGDWVKQMVAAIRDVDARHMITVGVIPWALTWKNAKPLFYSPEICRPLDFVSVHFYPKKGKVAEAIDALSVYDIGKPLVIEEMFPLRCGIDELEDFIDQSRTQVDGWISFYWGETIDENRQKGDLTGAVVAQWLERFQALSPLKENGP